MEWEWELGREWGREWEWEWEWGREWGREWEWEWEWGREWGREWEWESVPVSFSRKILKLFINAKKISNY
jgi:hypothetical protein